MTNDTLTKDQSFITVPSEISIRLYSKIKNLLQTCIKENLQIVVPGIIDLGNLINLTNLVPEVNYHLR